MKPLAVMLGAACTARILWWLPPWVTLALVGALALAAAGEAGIGRWRRAHPRPMPLIADDDDRVWHDCAQRKGLGDGSYLICVRRKDHEGDHVADRSSVAWSTST
jgi:hypothetical protein